MTDIWQAGKTYTPGSLVIPATAAPTTITQPSNAGFETGDLTGWTTPDPSRWVVELGGGYSSTHLVRVAGSENTSIASDTRVPIKPGQRCSVSGFTQLVNNGTDDQASRVFLHFYDAGGNLLPEDVDGNLISGKGGVWHASTAAGNAPADAASFGIGMGVDNGSHGGTVAWDTLSYSYYIQPVTAGLIFKATQAAPGKSGSAEPTWPTTTGVSVTDNEVTWEGVIATRLVWKAIPLLKSGDTEPTWPQAVGASVRDGTIDWTASSAQITDPNCPHSKIVAIAAGKVYAGDNDIIRYCATVNPLDWSAKNDAGFLPFGLNTYGSNPVAAMNLYRSNLVPFNAEGFQMWQVDTDPANTTLLDALPVASNYNKALAPVANDLLFLSSQGVRSIGIAASSTNLQASDVGMPIDVLVKPAMAQAALAGDDPLATFLPALGQYWIAFNAADRASCTVFVYTLNQIGQVGKWSRYVFPFPIDAYTIVDDDLYLRSNDDVLMYDDTLAVDFGGDAREVVFPGIVQYQWLDFGRPGVSKQVIGFDLVGSGNPNFALGYDQSSEGTFTTDFAVPADSVPGMIIPLPVMAPSMSVRVSYPGGQAWCLQAISIYLQDMRAGT